MAAGQMENMGRPCSKNQADNPTSYKEIQENSIQQKQTVHEQQSQEEQPPDKQPDNQPETAKQYQEQTQVTEQSQAHKTSKGHFHEQSVPAKQSGKYQASKKETHERQSWEQTAPVDYFLEQSEAGEQPAGTDRIMLERCWYCMKSLFLEELNISQGNESLTSSGGTELNYQQDPRPHFGVAHSSRSTAYPLWSSDGPREMKRDLDEKNQDSVSNCPHCHLRLPLNTLLWHKEKCLLFGGPKKDV